jgi:hypothetical protein
MVRRRSGIEGPPEIDRPVTLHHRSITPRSRAFDDGLFSSESRPTVPQSPDAGYRCAVAYRCLIGGASAARKRCLRTRDGVRERRGKRKEERGRRKEEGGGWTGRGKREKEKGKREKRKGENRGGSLLRSSAFTLFLFPFPFPFSFSPFPFPLFLFPLGPSFLFPLSSFLFQQPNTFPAESAPAPGG